MAHICSLKNILKLTIKINSIYFAQQFQSTLHLIFRKIKLLHCNNYKKNLANIQQKI